MSSTKYIHDECMRAWLDGKRVQAKLTTGWSDCITLAEANEQGGGPPFLRGGSYRIKPEPVVVKYRRLLWKRWPHPSALYVETVHPTSNLAQYENNSCFVKWIDTEWQEYEVES